MTPPVYMAGLTILYIALLGVVWAILFAHGRWGNAC